MNTPYCHKHNREKEVHSGDSAHPANWYCYKCEKEKENEMPKSYTEATPPKNMKTPEMINEKHKSKYHKEIKPGVIVDVYDVLVAFEVTCPATAHAIKKLLMPGARGTKSKNTDLNEAIQSIERAKEFPEEERYKVTMNPPFINKPV